MVRLHDLSDRRTVWTYEYELGEVSLPFPFPSATRLYPPNEDWTPSLTTALSEICGADAEERSIVLGLMNAMGYAFNAWLPYLTYPTVDAPRFTKGFVFSTLAFVAQFAITGAVWWMQRRELRIKARSAGQ